ncbi:MAG: GDP-mannose 4,6-dehydratase [Methanospirillaceae archaeon]|nr:GDP-mannose 4,6-dehydratase [Methanospirillaceae archaeon]
MRAVVTGGAGFIGSHLVDHLVEAGDEVIVIDCLAKTSTRYIDHYIQSGEVTFIHANLLSDTWQGILSGVNRVYHMAADPDVRESSIHPQGQLQNTIIATHRVLEAMREYGVREIVFTSTSTVYGEATVIPTPESYTPMEPVSVYGASKLACEALISAYSHSYDMQSWIFRFANIVGSRSGHGIIIDFIRKISDNPDELEILGDGKQIKSYLLVSACIEGILFGAGNAKKRVNFLNIGSEDWINVTAIADIIVSEMGLSHVTYHYTGGSRGWVGDVPQMQLSIDTMKKLGWEPGINSEESIRGAVRSLLAERRFFESER